MSEIHTFISRGDFRDWLYKNCLSDAGIWLKFSKDNSIKTLTANEALEEALCFGWIDGKITKIDEIYYKKYFKQRGKKSSWSKRNRDLAAALESSGKMTDFGRKKISEAKQSGCWDSPLPPKITDTQIEDFTKLIEGNEPAYTNFMAMSDSIKKAYTGFYLDAKREQTKIKRLSGIIDRLNKNLKPM